MRKPFVGIWEATQSQTMGLLANRYSVHVTIAAVVMAVVISNIRVGRIARAQEAELQRSIVAEIILGEEEAVTVEEQGAVPEAVTYLGSQAVTFYESVAAEGATYDGTDDGLYEIDESEIALVSPFGTSVRVEPEPAGEYAPPTRTKVEQYVVQPGDTVGEIARRFGLSTSTLLASNGLTARSYIRPGQTLTILPIDGLVYKVKSGDTIAKIAKTYSSDAQKILEANNMTSTSSLTVGTELILPDGRLPAPPTPKRPTQIATSIKNVIAPSPDRGALGMIWPTAARRITQYWRGAIHTGVDIAGPTGTAIYAADDGVVLISGWNSGGYGNMIVLDNGGGIYTRYAHASRNLVKRGDTVKKGDTIALMGSTGRSTGPHLHFEVMVGSTSRRVNPFDYVR